MRAVDTNVIVRFFINDDPLQAEKARALIGQVPLFVSRTVILETDWVLRRVYGQDRVQVLRALRGLLGLPAMTVEDIAMVTKALALAEAGLDLADALHLLEATGCEDLVTFDKAFARTGRQVASLPVVAL